MNFVCLLGTKGGPAIRPGSTNPTSNLLSINDQLIVVDCGLGVTRGLVDQGVELKTLSTIFISHLHSDHYLELGPMLHTAWVAGLQQPVSIFGPPGIDRYWSAFLDSMRDDIELRQSDEGRVPLRDLVSISDLEDGFVDNLDGVEVSALRNQHPPLVDTFALSFKHSSGHVVFSGDTAYYPPLADFSRGADLLIHEAMLKEALPALFERIGNADDRLMQHWMRSHTLAEDVGRIASRAGVKALALVHLIPSDDPSFTPEDWLAAVGSAWTGKIYVGTDGLRINFGAN